MIARQAPRGRFPTGRLVPAGGSRSSGVFRSLCVGLLVWTATVSPTGTGTGYAQRSPDFPPDVRDESRVLIDADAAHRRGLLLRAQGDNAGAEAALKLADEGYRQAVALAPKKSWIYAPLADVMLRRGHIEGAYGMLVQQQRAGARDLGIRVQLCRTMARMKRTRQALELSQTLSRELPSEPMVSALLGELLAESGSPTLAIPELRKATASPLHKSAATSFGVDSHGLRMLLGRLLIEDQRPAEAVPVLRELSRDPAAPVDGLILLAEALYASAQPDQAVAVLLQALQRPGAHTMRATVLLSEALQGSGQLQKAIELLSRAGDHPDIHLALARLHLRRQPPETASAADVLSKAAGLHPKHLRLCVENAALLEQTQKGAAVLKEVTRCEELAKNPQVSKGDSPTAVRETLALLAQLEARAGWLDEPIARLREALAVPGARGDTAPLTARLSTALTRRGLERLPAATTPPPNNPALTDLEEALRLRSTPSGRQALALGLLSAGQPKEAVEQLRPLVEAGPNGSSEDPRLLAAYGRALREAGRAADSVPVLFRGQSLAAAAGLSDLASTLTLELSRTYAALGQPREALRLVQGTLGDTAARMKSQAYLSVVRALYSESESAAARRPGIPPLRTAAELPESPAPPSLSIPTTTLAQKPPRGPFPPLRALTEAPLYAQGGRRGRGPFPPLRGPADVPIVTLSLNLARAPASGPPDTRLVLRYMQEVLRSGELATATERAEAIFWQVIAQAQAGQLDLAQRLLTEASKLFDEPTITAVLGPGGFLNLRARLLLRSGDLHQGVSVANQALAKLPTEAVRALQGTMATAYTQKAVDMLDRAELERAFLFVKSAQQLATAVTPENQARAAYNVAVLLLHRGRSEEARAMLSRIDPLILPEALLGLGNCADQSGDRPVALDFYRRYLQAADVNNPHRQLVEEWVDSLGRFYEAAPPPPGPPAAPAPSSPPALFGSASEGVR